MSKHFALTDASFAHTRRQAQILAKAAPDGIYVIRTSVPQGTMGAAESVRAYKTLANVEENFRSLKSIDLRIRPIHHRTEDRTRAHVFLCMLAGHLIWHLRAAWAPLTYTDQNRPAPTTPSPRPPAHRPLHARPPPAPCPTAHQSIPSAPCWATRTRNTLRATGTDATFDLMALPTPIQRQATDLIEAHLPHHWT